MQILMSLTFSVLINSYEISPERIIMVYVYFLAKTVFFFNKLELQGPWSLTWVQ